jgi:hypothetical protein
MLSGTISELIMTNEQILELAREHLEEFDTDNGADCVWSDFAATKEQLIEFALAIADIEYDRGFDDGWESRAESEYLNSGLIGEPQ